MNPNDPGQLEFLRDQERATAPNFLARVRNKIYRRTAASQVASFSWHMPRLVLVEIVSVLSHILGTLGGGERQRRR